MRLLVIGLLGFLIASCATVDVQSRTAEDRAFLQSIGIQTVGAEIVIDRYCITYKEDDAFIQRFIVVIQKGGMQAYNDLLNDPQLPCWDARMHENAIAVKVVLVKKIKDIKISNGEELTFWMVKDKRDGFIGYTWLQREGQNI